MQALKLRTRIEPDGHLRLDVPTELPAGEIEVVLVINPRESKGTYDFSDLAGRLKWQGDPVATPRESRDEW